MTLVSPGQSAGGLWCVLLLPAARIRDKPTGPPMSPLGVSGAAALPIFLLLISYD
ncbi:hypothetical protein GCM10022406_40650 [Hymenobacter algoricola]|uniref:Uncharacterized protein n=1 Tax=Hymenobacter algoricola TaxID=486267 RepID=A0ABP7NVK5_9BACT